MDMNRNLIKSGIFCFGLLVAGWCEAASFSEAFVFDDSLSDSGNYFTQYGGMYMQPYETENVPGKPYAIGGHHFTNGANWERYRFWDAQHPTREGHSTIAEQAEIAIENH
jgi:phospholipase/lecithinase/hemolysin